MMFGTLNENVSVNSHVVTTGFPPSAYTCHAAVLDSRNNIFFFQFSPEMVVIFLPHFLLVEFRHQYFL